jgi:hypothetical protein
MTHDDAVFLIEDASIGDYYCDHHSGDEAPDDAAFAAWLREWADALERSE